VCADGTTAGLSITSSDGTWSYSRSGSGPAWTTTITDPAGNQTVAYFDNTSSSTSGLYETERKIYQGAVGGNLLRDKLTCYNGAAMPCNSTAIALPITRRTSQFTVGSLVAKTDVFLNSLGLVTEVDDYDWGSVLLRKSITTYAALGNNISNRPASVVLQNAAGGTVSSTTYSYDQTAVTASGSPQLLTISGSRGNATTISSGGLSTTLTYFDNGNVQTFTDPKLSVYSYTYAACGNSLLTQISKPLGLSKSQGWNCTGGVRTSVTDENGQPTSIAYNDPYFWRPASSQDALGNTRYMTYTSPTQAGASMTFNSGISINNVVSILNSVGQSHLSQVQQAPGSSYYDTTEVLYSWVSSGRQVKNILPFTTTLGGTNPNGPNVTTVADALGRPVSVSGSGGGSLTYSYSLNDALGTLGPSPVGENSKQKQVEYNAFGWPTSVCEITSTQPGGGSACNQNTAATGFRTSYIYDAMGNLTGVTQGAQSRSYSYDSLARMTSETAPEGGTVTYVWDTDASCNTTSLGDLIRVAKADGNNVCYYYDALHRVTDIGANNNGVCYADVGIVMTTLRV